MADLWSLYDRPSATLPAMSSVGGAQSASLDGSDAENLREAEKAKEAKRKGRFQIVESEDKARLPKSQVNLLYVDKTRKQCFESLVNMLCTYPNGVRNELKFNRSESYTCSPNLPTSCLAWGRDDPQFALRFGSDIAWSVIWALDLPSLSLVAWFTTCSSHLLFALSPLNGLFWGKSVFVSLAMTLHFEWGWNKFV